MTACLKLYCQAGSRNARTLTRPSCSFHTYAERHCSKYHGSLSRSRFLARTGRSSLTSIRESNERRLLTPDARLARRSAIAANRNVFAINMISGGGGGVLSVLSLEAALARERSFRLILISTEYRHSAASRRRSSSDRR